MLSDSSLLVDCIDLQNLSILFLEIESFGNELQSISGSYSGVPYIVLE